MNNHYVKQEGNDLYVNVGREEEWKLDEILGKLLFAS